MQTWCNWQHRGLVRSRYGFNPHRLIQMCWCGSTAEQLSCKQSVAGSTPVTSPRMRSRKCAVSDRGVTDKHGGLPTLWYEFKSRRSLQCECGVRANIRVCQSLDTSSSLVIRSRSPVAQRWSICLTNRGLRVQILPGLPTCGSVA